MKTKSLLAFTVVVGIFFLSTGAYSQNYKSRYTQDAEDRKMDEIASGYRQTVTEVHPTGTISPNDPHVQVIGWDPAVPLPRFINTIKEGETNQLAVLRLLSAPNVIWRDPITDKEKWVYWWIWSYKNEQNFDDTIIYMNHSGKKLKNNKKPVLMVITFNDKDIVDTYKISLLKVKKDSFDEY